MIRSGHAPKQPITRTLAYWAGTNPLDVIPPPSFRRPIRRLTEQVKTRNRDRKDSSCEQSQIHKPDNLLFTRKTPSWSRKIAV